MFGLGDLFWVYQNSGPALLFILVVLVGYAWKHDVAPRLDAIEATQEDRGDELQERALSAQERDILLDNAHKRIDQAEQALHRLKARVRNIEQAVAAEHGRESLPDDDLDVDDSAPDGSRGYRQDPNASD